MTPGPPTIRLISCIGVGVDLDMLPHFLRHYAGLGIDPAAMHLSLNAERADDPDLEAAERILSAFGTPPPARWIAPYTSDGMWEERRRLQRDVARTGDWIVNSDIDEHYVFPAPLREIVAFCEAEGATCVQGLQIDRFAPDGALAAVAPYPSMAEQFPVEGEASFYVFGAGEHHGVSATTKLMLHRADVFPRRGGHNPEGLAAGSRKAERDGPRFLLGRPLHTIRQIDDPAFRFSFPFQSRHYKWTASRLPTLDRRIATPGVSPAGLEYGGKVRAFLSEHGRMPLDRVALRDPDARPATDWRGTVRALRRTPDATPPPATRLATGDVFVVIRAAGERTEALCRALVQHEVALDRITVLHEVPFAKAVRRAFERGVADGAEWTLCLDADVLLRPGAVADLVAEARRRGPETFGVSGRVADKLLGQRRSAGQHLYRTELLAEALSTAPFDPEQRRPETHVKRYMEKAGHPWVQSDVLMGLHDFEQSFADIFRKVATHARKHQRFMGYARRFWARLAAEDPDMRVALWSLEAPERIAELPPPGPGTRSVSIDRRIFPDDISAFLGQIGLFEKPPLAQRALRPSDVAARLAAFDEAPEWLEDRAAIEANAAPATATAPPPPKLLSCIGVGGNGGGDLPLLAHWLDHHARLGIPPANVHVILNAEDADDPALAQARIVLERAGAPAPELWIGRYTSQEMWDRRNTLQSEVATAEDWIVNADADEFHDYPAPLHEVTALCEAQGARYVQGPFVDRVAPDGELIAVTPDISVWEQFPHARDVGIAAGKVPGDGDGTGTVKLMLHRGDVLPSLGGHGVQRAGPDAALYRLPLMQFPGVKAPGWRARLPFRVHHFKWTAGLAERLEARRAAPGASAAGSRYGARILDFLASHDGRIPLEEVPSVPAALGWPGDWRARVAEIATRGEALSGQQKRRQRLRTARQSQAKHTADGWRVRQLTFGSGQGAYHSHSYYDIPVMDAGARRAAAFRMSFAERWMTPDDAVEVGIVDIERGGFVPVGTSRAWSWQQGPMAQWLPDGRMVWNDRHRDGPRAAPEGDAFVARLYDPETGFVRTLPRPVYALTPSGAGALSVNMARLDHARPGYGYVGGRGAAVEVGAPEDDGMWYLDLTRPSAKPRLILPLSRAVAFLAERLPPEERRAHLSGELAHWFNHVKVSPDGKRFTTKLRWRAAGFEGKWNGTMGVSLSCGINGSDLALVAQGTSHVMWLDPEHLYFWHQAEGCFAMVRDAVPEATHRTVPHPELITANVHFRHIPDAPETAIYDTPYAEQVDVIELDRGTGATTRLARFGGHVPKHGPFRCDLHPVPSDDGGRILVTSLQDGGRQLYVLERDGRA